MPKILFVLMSLVLFAGCGPDHRVMQVDIEGTKTFPRELVGTWKTQDGKWEIVFDDYGKIKETLIPLGEMRLRPGQTVKFEMPRYEGKGEYTAGKWSTFWSQSTMELNVIIVIDHFYQDVGNHAVEGKTTDYLFGTVSQDYVSWTVEQSSSAYIEALIFEGWTLIDRKEMVNDQEPLFHANLVFKKSW